MSLGSIIAQAAAGEVNAGTAMVVYGPMGIFCGWFMLRVEKLINKVSGLGHRLDGMSKSLMVDVLSRESSGPTARAMAQAILTEISEREATEKAKVASRFER